MALCAIALVGLKAVLGIDLRLLLHIPVPGDLGQDGRRRDIGALAVAADDRLNRQAKVPRPIAVDQRQLRPDSQLVQRPLHVLNVIINLLRSVPFLILMILVFPLTRAIVGTVVGTPASIVPLVIAAFPFVARLVEGSLREVNPNIIETAQSMGASPMQIICKVMLPVSVPSLISNATIAITTVLGYSAMSGIIGGGGLGKIAIDYGYYRYKYLVMLVAVVILILLVQLFQSVGTWLSKRCDKRLKH